MGNRNSVGNTHMSRPVSPLRVGADGSGNESKVTGSSSGEEADIKGTEPFNIVVVPDTGADGQEQAQGPVAQAGAKLNCPTPSCLTLPAGGVVPGLKELPKGLMGAVGGALLGGASTSAAMGFDANMDPASQVIVSCVIAVCVGMVGYLTEQACRSDN